MLVDETLKVQKKVKDLLHTVCNISDFSGFRIDREIVVVFKDVNGQYEEEAIPLYYLMMTDEEILRDMEENRKRKEGKNSRNSDLYLEWLGAKKLAHTLNDVDPQVKRRAERLYNEYKGVFEVMPVTGKLEDVPQEEDKKDEVG